MCYQYVDHTFIRIGRAADYNIADMNELLNRYGNDSGLYSKNISDCICIFVLNKYSGEEKVSMYNEILNRFSEAVNNEDAYTKFMVTAVFDEKLADIKNKYDLNNPCDRMKKLTELEKEFIRIRKGFESCVLQ